MCKASPLLPLSQPRVSPLKFTLRSNKISKLEKSLCRGLLCLKEEDHKDKALPARRSPPAARARGRGSALPSQPGCGRRKSLFS